MGSKIGIVLAFLLSVAAAAGAYFLYKELTAERAHSVALSQKYDEAKENALTLQSEKEQIKAAKDQYQAESAEYQRKVRSAEVQISQLRVETARVASERLNLTQQLREKEARLIEMEKKVAELQKQAEDAMRACNISPSDIKASAASSGGQLVFNAPASISSPAPSLSSTVSSPTVSVAELTGPRVLTVNRKFNFVVVNLGLKDGVKMGEQMKVVKSGADSATLQVEKLYDKFSAAAIVNEDPKNQVREGDEVRKL